MNKRLAIIGSSALGRQIAHQVSMLDSAFEVVGFFDDFKPAGGDVLGPVDTVLQKYAEGCFDCLSIGVGYLAMDFRAACAEQFAGRIPLARIELPGTFIDPTVEIEEGSVILTGTMLDQDVKIGRNCFFSLGCSISHESVIGANTYCAPRVTVCGRCNIGRNVFLGAGCIVRDGIIITDGVVIGAGAVVVKDILAQGVYIGCPARRLA